MIASARALPTMVLAAGLLAAGWVGPAWAASSCAGTLSGSLISPLPKQAVVYVHITDSSAANLALAERFYDGLRAGGASLSDGGSVTMELATSIAGLSASSGTGAVSPEFGQVGLAPNNGEPPTLTMSISLMDRAQAQIDWVGYVTCKIKSPDMSAVAYDLGHAIGRSIGQDFSPRPL